MAPASEPEPVALDIAYEEARPMIARFRFNSLTKELLMTTNYTQVVSVDSITMTNPYLRIRKVASSRVGSRTKRLIGTCKRSLPLTRVGFLQRGELKIKNLFKSR